MQGDGIHFSVASFKRIKLQTKLQKRLRLECQVHCIGFGAGASAAALGSVPNQRAKRWKGEQEDDATRRQGTLSLIYLVKARGSTPLVEVNHPLQDLSAERKQRLSTGDLLIEMRVQHEWLL